MPIDPSFRPAVPPNLKRWPRRALTGTASTLHALADWLRRHVGRDDRSLLDTDEDWVRDLVERS